jgi:hypothetical protein
MTKHLPNLLVLLFLLGSLSSSKAQLTSYIFSSDNDVYTPLSGATDLNSIEVDDAMSSSVSLGFTFNFNGNPYTSCRISSNGFLTFNASPIASGVGNNLSASDASYRPCIAPLWDDLDGGGGQATYLTSGVAPNRVFTVEWLNWQWNYSANAAVISFQARLYESTNVIEFQYRQEGAAVNSGSASIGLAATATGSGNFLSLNNTGSCPSASSTTETSTLNTKPATGQIYRFSPGTCPVPIGVAASVIGSTTATVSWTAPSGATQYDYILTNTTGTICDPPIQSGTTASTSVGFTGLTSQTTYRFFIRTNCGSATSDWLGPYTFTTSCAPTPAPTSEAFNAYLPSTCWSEATGAYGPSITLSGTTSSWTNDVFANNTTINNPCAKFNVFGTSSGWLLSNQIDLGTNPTQLEFDIALTTWNLTTCASFDANDTVALVISLDGGNTWSSANTLKMWTSANSIGCVSDHITVPLASYSGVVRFGFWAKSGATGVDVDFFVDNFTVSSVSCPSPTALTLGTINPTDATVSWTPQGTETSWEVEYGPAGFTLGTGTVVTVSSPTITVTGLSPMTTYRGYVRAICGPSDRSSYISGQFTTPGYKIYTNGQVSYCSPTHTRYLGTTGEQYPYDKYSFTVATTGTYNIFAEWLALDGVTAKDGYLVLYQNSFNPASPGTNYVASDDDEGTIQYSKITTTLTAGVTYIVVGTTFYSLSSSSAINEMTMKIYVEGISAATSPATADINGQPTLSLAASGSLTTTCDFNGWRYYGTSRNSYGLGVQWGTNTTSRDGSSATVTDGATPLSSTNTTQGTWVMDRYWNVNVGTQPTTPVTVRFVYDPAEKTAIESAANAFATANALSYEPFVWFKTNTGAFDPSMIAPNAVAAGNNTALTGADGTQNGITYVDFAGITHFSGGSGAAGAGGGGGSPLPVELLDFKLNIQGTKVQLLWNTAAEVNFNKFKIERSADGTKFHPIGELAAKGNDSNYEFVDATPILGKNFYRLRMMDNDGTYKITKVLLATIKTNRISFNSLSPVPASTLINADIYAPRNMVAQVHIIDALGRTVAHQTLSLTEGNVSYPIGIESLANGTYHLQIIDETGISLSTSFVKVQ